MKNGDIVYVPHYKQFGFVQSVMPNGRIQFVNLIDAETGQVNLKDVINLVVQAVNIIKQAIVLIKYYLAKRKLRKANG